MVGSEAEDEADGVLAVKGFDVGASRTGLGQAGFDDFLVLGVERVLLHVQDIQIAVEPVGLPAPARRRS